MQVTMSLHRGVQQHPDRPMTIFGDRVRTYAETADRVARLAAGLQSLGVATNDRVGMLALNSDRYHEYYLATFWAGAALNPVNVRWSPTEIAYSLDDCDTKVLIVDDAFLPMVPVLREKSNSLATVIYAGEGETPEGMVDFEQLIADNEPVADAERGNEDLAGIFYTGGTTGFPKGVMLSHRNLVISAMGSTTTVDLAARGGRVLHAAPMFHLADFAMWNIAMLIGSTHVIIPMFTPAGTLEAIAKHRVTDALLVPTMIQMLVDSPDAASADLSSITGVLYGASVISGAVLARARATFPSARFTQAYGMTELSPVTTLLTPEDHDDPVLSRGAGRAVAHAMVKIVDIDDNEVPRGTVGEVVAKGGHVMLGYWNKPEETAAAIRDGWMHTGDGGYMNENGYVFIVDRLKDMIITGGENVYSAEVENAVAQHPAVGAVAVIGIPDEQWGERVHAVVVLKPGATATQEEIIATCRELIAGYKTPKSVAFIDALPVNGAGKILKRELRTMDWTQASPSA